MTKTLKYSRITIVSRLLALIGNLSYIILLAVINGSIGNLIGSFIPILGSLTVAKYLGADVSMSYPLLFTLTICFGLLRGALRYFEQYSNHLIAFKLLAKIRHIIFEKLRVLCPAKLETKQKGSIISMITADTETIEVFYAHTLSPICIATVSSLTIFIFISTVVNIYMGLFALAAYFIIGVIMPSIGNKAVKKEGLDYRTKFTNFNSYYLDAIKGSKDIILHNDNQTRIDTIDEYSKQLINSNKKLKSKSLKMSITTNILIYIFNFTMLLIGLYLVINKELNPALMAVGLVSLMSSYGPVISVSQLPENLSQTFASGDRIISLLDEHPAVEDIKNKKSFDFEKLETKNLSFAYDKSKPVLKDINITVKKGEIVGIMGHSGCGKSTILKLLLRFWEKQTGEILYNGIDINEINSDSLKQNVTMVSQSTYLFDDSIKNNLLIAKPNATLDEIKLACKKAGISNLIENLSNGYDTLVGSGGISLSAGETQRLGLARAFLSDCKLILLDEPTSNVDAINEGIILKSLALNKDERGIILVSHRESTMSIADRVYKF